MAPSAPVTPVQAPQTIDTSKKVLHKRKKKPKKPKSQLSAPAPKTPPTPNTRSRSQSSRNSNQSTRKNHGEISPDELDLALNRVLDSNLRKEAKKNWKKEKNKDRIDSLKSEKRVYSENDKTPKLHSHNTVLSKKIETVTPPIMPIHERKSADVENSKMNRKNLISVNPRTKKSNMKKKNMMPPTKSLSPIPTAQVSKKNNEAHERGSYILENKEAISDKIKNDKGKKNCKDKINRTSNKKGKKHRTKCLNLESSEGNHMVSSTVESTSNISHLSEKLERTSFSAQNPVPHQVTNKNRNCSQQIKSGNIAMKQNSKQEQKLHTAETETEKFPSNKPSNGNMSDSYNGLPRTIRSRPNSRTKRHQRINQEKQQSKQDKEFTSQSKSFCSNVHNTDVVLSSAGDLNQASNHIINKKKIKENDKGKKGTKVQKSKAKKKKSKLGQDKQNESSSISTIFGHSTKSNEDDKNISPETIIATDVNSISNRSSPMIKADMEDMPNESNTNYECIDGTTSSNGKTLNVIESSKSSPHQPTTQPLEENELNPNLQNSVVNPCETQHSHDDVSTIQHYTTEDRCKKYETNLTQHEVFHSQNNDCMMSISDYPSNHSAFGIQVSYPMPYEQNFFRNNQYPFYSHMNHIHNQTQVPMVADDDRNDDTEVVSCDSNQVYDGSANSFYRSPYYTNEFEMQQPLDGNLPLYTNSIGLSDLVRYGSMQNQSVLSNHEYNESRSDKNCGGHLQCSNGIGMFSTPQPMVGGAPGGSFQPYHFGINYAQLQPQPFYPNPQFYISASGIAGQVFTQNWIESKTFENKESNNAILNVRAPSFEPNSKNSHVKDQ